MIGLWTIKAFFYNLKACICCELPLDSISMDGSNVYKNSNDELFFTNNAQIQEGRVKNALIWWYYGGVYDSKQYIFNNAQNCLVIN